MNATGTSDQSNQKGCAALAKGTLVSVVPTYKVTSLALPLIEQLSKECPTLVVDDCSPCTSDSVLHSASALGARILRMPDRAGIARSLNIGLDFARERESAWLLTVDQDTTIADNYIYNALTLLRAHGARHLAIGALGASRIDVNGHVINLFGGSSIDLLNVPEVIQSGTLWNVQAMTSIGGFNESLDMDAVDAEACLRLRECGYRVTALDTLEIIHEIGTTRVQHIFGRDVHVTHHSRKRLTAMVVNRMALFRREWRQSPVHALRTIRRVLINYLLSGAT